MSDSNSQIKVTFKKGSDSKIIQNSYHERKITYAYVGIGPWYKEEQASFAQQAKKGCWFCGKKICNLTHKYDYVAKNDHDRLNKSPYPLYHHQKIAYRTNPW